MFERILVPLDGSRLSAKAVTYALGIANKFGSEVILLEVVKQAPPVPMAEPAGMMSPVTAQTVIEAAQMQDQSNVSDARRYLRRQQKKFTDKGIKASYQVVLGNPTEAILSFYRKQHIDLVVMTTHGRSGIKRAILGSVADAIVREPGGPVLVIRV